MPSQPETQALAHDGIDFQLQRAELHEAAKLAMAQAEAQNTPFRALFDTWLTDGVSQEDGNAELRRTFDKDILPAIGDLPVREVNDGHLLERLRKVGRKRGRGRTSERMPSECRQMYGWAIKRRPWRSLLTHGSPAESVELKQVVPRVYESGIRERTLSVVELRELRDIFAKTTHAYEKSPNKTVTVHPLQMKSQPVLWICLGVGVGYRSGELPKARWENVDLDHGVWFVPQRTRRRKSTGRFSSLAIGASAVQGNSCTDGQEPVVLPGDAEGRHACVREVSQPSCRSESETAFQPHFISPLATLAPICSAACKPVSG